MEYGKKSYQEYLNIESCMNAQLSQCIKYGMQSYQVYKRIGVEHGMKS